ncbi:MAG: metallophosphoesterase [Anaerolineae bacterium]|nr:metallophosphoesterase [Anaerolineae bacterium]MDW8172971.1 metallophosphoesterase [Anaerolineae bacterium]
MLTFVHISDSHLHPDRSFTKRYSSVSPLVGAEAIVRAIQALPLRPAFVLHTGDVVNDLSPDEYDLVRQVFDPLDLPVYYLAGNHDDATVLQSVAMGTDALRRYLYYDFEVQGVQIVCLDSNARESDDGQPIQPPTGYLPAQQMDWLRGIVQTEDERPLIVAVHHNPVASGIPWLDGDMRLVNGDALHEALLPARRRLRAVLFGHVHMPIEMVRDGILYSAAASTWCQFQGYPGVGEGLDSVAQDEQSPIGFSIVHVHARGATIRRHNVLP